MILLFLPYDSGCGLLQACSQKWKLLALWYTKCSIKTANSFGHTKYGEFQLMTHEYLSMRSGNASNCMNLACESRRLCRILFTLPSNRRHRFDSRRGVGGGGGRRRRFFVFFLCLCHTIFLISFILGTNRRQEETISNSFRWVFIWITEGWAHGSPIS